ncbi:response regulator transcription factor [Halopseudomonas sabulinigri]|uniref:DNA-binding response regulator, NarL/FixJ family, contains REC and HTH domains n=1 Tax=Halopseudomonas sabulinigri TaxID=472181 RepID=A0A1H1WGI5_9GAMM|nr:response regulator transcription factor [Halopseudomonas sabulinigri]SDS96213.1 DNA-binding response regulator, NarL/FixJ family, contains REC and HTH domains [Halopseudomonas sabulinigri]
MNKVLILEDLKDAQTWLSEAVLMAWPQARMTLYERLGYAIAALDLGPPDLCLVDLQLPDGSGIDFIRECSQRYPDTLLVVATMYDDDMHLFPALQAGAKGYLLKDDTQTQIALALEGVARGIPPLSPQIAQRMLSFFQQDGGAANRWRPEAGGLDDSAGLSEREREFLLVIGNGYKTAEAADMLGVSYHTAAKHIKNIYAKLGISSRAQAVQEAIRMGLIN